MWRGKVMNKSFHISVHQTQQSEVENSFQSGFAQKDKFRRKRIAKLISKEKVFL